MAALLLLVGVVVAYDALVVSDEERIEALADDVTGPVTDARMNAARGRWIDLGRQPFEVSAFGRTELYRAGDEAALDARAASALRTLSGSRLRAITSSVELQGERGTLTMRVLDDRNGMAQLSWSLAKRGDDWLLARLAIRR